MEKYRKQLESNNVLFKKVALFISRSVDEDGAVKELLTEIESAIGRDLLNIVKDALNNRENEDSWD